MGRAYRFKVALKEKIDMMNDLFSVFTEEEKKEYLRLLRKIYDKLRGDNE